jgi:Carbon storage regulator (could also regulate swarming and quorum sensing)
MLVLTRKLGESIIIGDDIITVLNIRKHQIYLDVHISDSFTIKLQGSVSIKDGITVKLVKIDKAQVKLGIEAPESVTINREEVYKEDQVGNVLSSNSSVINHTEE